MKKTILLPTLCLVLSTLCYSCGSGGCEKTRETYCVAEFSSTTDARINKINVYGLKNGTEDKEMLSDNSPKTLEFILNPDTTITDIRLQMTVIKDNAQSQVDDTLHVVYDPRPYFLDMECGCSVFFTLKEVTSTAHFLQNVIITRNEITNAPNINLAIEY